uniref:Exocyst subunit Exo70 family protein n=1 Tax=Oryza nivara TaxID=4536 RepID=A0A0E0HXX9_ORYNI
MAQKMIEDDCEKVYVAISPIQSVCLPMLLWTLNNTPPGKTVILLRIYRPARTNLIPIAVCGSVQTRLPAGFYTHEARTGEKMLRDYLRVCESQKFHAEVLTAEKENVELGLVELVSELKITTLIMGGGLYRKGGMKNMMLADRTITVLEKADPSCKIFVLNRGNLFFIRERRITISTSTKNGFAPVEVSDFPTSSYHFLGWHPNDYASRSSISSSLLSETQSKTDDGCDSEQLDDLMLEYLHPGFDNDSFRIVSKESLIYLDKIANQLTQSGHAQDLHQAPFDDRCHCHFIPDMDRILGIQSRNDDEAQWKNCIKHKMTEWLHELRYVCTIVLSAHKQLMQWHLAVHDSLALDELSKAVKEPITQLLTFASTVSKMHGSPEKFFHMLHMHQALTEASPVLQEVFSGELKESFTGELHKILHTLKDGTKETLDQLRVQIQSYSSEDMPEGGGIHLVTTYLIRYIMSLTQNTGSLDAILAHSYDDHALAEERMMNTSGHLISMLISDLTSMLYRLSKSYMSKSEGLQWLFLLNNENFILRKIEEADIRSMLPADWIQNYQHRVEQNKVNYIEATWALTLSYLKKRIKSPFNFLHPSPMKEFTSSFETTCNAQTHWKVPDPKLRVELRQTIRDYVLPAYCAFMENHPNLEKSSGRSLENIRNKLSELFEG